MATDGRNTVIYNYKQCYRAMLVLDLLFNSRFNTRLEQFVLEFKCTRQEANNHTTKMPLLGAYSQSRSSCVFWKCLFIFRCLAHMNIIKKSFETPVNIMVN